MENDNENNNEIKRYEERFQSSVTELYNEKELKTKWHKEILENPSMQEYFKSFSSSSIESFISSYLIDKYFAYSNADSYQQRAEKKRSRWIDEAEDHLKIILNKKLFDYQCLWRAEKVTNEYIRITNDFLVWQEKIFSCPFIEPLTQEDIKMYQDFLLQTVEDYDNIAEQYELQNYDDFKINYQGNEEDGLQLPDWYEFHNLRTGNSSLLLLPDIRGEKELFYARLFVKDRDKDLPPYIPNPDLNKPHLSAYDKENLLFFVNTYEDEETRIKFANYFEVFKKHTLDRDYDLNELIMYMEEEEEIIPIEAHYDYRTALYIAYNKFKLNKLAEHLPYAYEHYLFNKKMGIPFEEGDNFYEDLSNNCLKMILDGRALNGEPRDLNF